MTWHLQLGTNTGTQIHFSPEPDFSRPSQKIESRHRTPTGREYVYKWGDMQRWSMSVRYVSSNDAAIVQSWWNTNAELLLLEPGGDVHSVWLTNEESPMANLDVPYADQWTILLNLGTY